MQLFSQQLSASVPLDRRIAMVTDEQVAVTPDRILALGLGFWGSKTLLSAVELGLFTGLAEGPAGLDELRERLGLHERGARDFLDALVALGMLESRDGV